MIGCAEMMLSNHKTGQLINCHAPRPKQSIKRFVNNLQARNPLRPSGVEFPPCPLREDPIPGRYALFTSLTNAMSDVFASPNSMLVAGALKSAFSIPANPAAMPRFSTITCFARSASRMGIP